MKDAWIDEIVKHECDYAPATCAVPATCKICGVAKDNVLSTEHTYVDGVCTICNGVDPDYEGEVVVPTTVTVSIADYAAANGWANSTKYTSLTMDSNVTVTVSGGSNTGKYYTSGTNWRIYQNENPKITFEASNGATIVSVKITYTVDKTGVLTLNGSNITSRTAVTVNATSVQFGVGNTGTATNGQVRITAIEVVYSSGVAACEHTNTTETTTATCTKAGSTTVTCTDCGATVSTKETAALGHTTDNGTCERCKETIGGDTPAEPVTVTFTTNAQGYTNGQKITNITIDSVISGTFDKGSNSNASKYYNTGTAIRMYGGNTLTIRSASGYVIDSIVITTQSSNKFNSNTTVNNTTITISGTTVTMSDLNTSSVVIKNGGTSGHARILTITVTYKAQ